MTKMKKRVNTLKYAKKNNHKKHYTNEVILRNHKNQETEIFAFCVITFELIEVQTGSAPQNDRLNFSCVKDIKVIGKKIWLEMVVKRTFISCKFWATPSTKQIHKIKNKIRSFRIRENM